MKFLLVLLTLIMASIIGLRDQKSTMTITGEDHRHNSPKDLIQTNHMLQNTSLTLNAYYSANHPYPDITTGWVPFISATIHRLNHQWGAKIKKQTKKDLSLILISTGQDITFENSDDIKRRI